MGAALTSSQASGGMALASMGLQAAGSIFGASSSDQAGRAQAGYYRYLGQQNEFQARVVEAAGSRQAGNIQDAAAVEYGKHLRNVKQVEGAQQAAGAAAGMAGTVTAEDIARDTANKARLDELAIRYNADSQADEVLRTAGITAFNLRSEAAGQRSAATQAERTGKRQATATLLGGASTIASTAASFYGKGGKLPKMSDGAAGAGRHSSKLFLRY